MKTDKTYENYIECIQVSFLDDGIKYTKQELKQRFPKSEYMGEGVIE